MEIERVGGMWVPQRELGRFSKTPIVDDGILDLDVTKVKQAAAQCQDRVLAIDVGAHIGSTSLALANMFHRVEAFEPMPPTYRALGQNVHRRRNINIHRTAVTSTLATMRFEFVARHSQLSRMLGDGQGAQFEDSIVFERVEGRPLDSFRYPRVSFIKVDVGGIELDVLAGAVQTIQRCQPVILVEQRGNDERNYGRRLNEGSTFLEKLGMIRVPFPFKNDWLYAFSR